MKQFCLKNHQTQQIFAALILTGILSLGAGITVVNSASANSPKNPQSVADVKQRNRTLPPSVINAVRRQIARTYRIPPDQLKVVSYTQQNWSDSCLGLGRPNEACGQVIIENGWRVVMSYDRQTWIVRTDATGRIVRLEGQGNPRNSNLPNSVSNAVLRSAAGQLGVPTSQLRIIEAQEQTWPDRCLGIPNPVELCASALTPGWRVMVEGQQQRLVYHSDRMGSQIRLNQSASKGSRIRPNETPSNIGSTNLPLSVTNAVLRDAYQRSGLPLSQLRIVESRQIQGSSSCLGLPPSPGQRGCTKDLRPLWQVTVEAREQRLVYHTTMDGSRIRLNEQASNIWGGGTNQGNSGGVIMPNSELPPPLSKGIVFRAIESGGIAGITTETVLTQDGRVIRRYTNRQVMAPVQMHQISRQEMQAFMQLLKRQDFAQFDRFAYPAPRGAADYMTVTLTSEAGTTSYADMGQDSLPEALQVVVQAWQQIAIRR